MRLTSLTAAAAFAVALIVPSFAQAAIYTLDLTETVKLVEITNPNAPAGTRSFAVRVDDPASAGADTLNIEGGTLNVNLTSGLLRFQINSAGALATPYEPFVGGADGGNYTESVRRTPRGTYFSRPDATINAYEAPGGTQNNSAGRPVFSAGITQFTGISLGESLGLPSADYVDGFTLGVLVISPNAQGAIVGSGTLDLRGQDVTNPTPFSFTITGGVVPEPASIAAVAGAAGLVLRRRRK
jgi:hypothetical protein